MNISIWGAEDQQEEQSVMERIDKNEGFFLEKILSSYHDETPPLATIEIETINRCNGTCSFCPVSAGNDRRTYTKMPTELFYSIIEQLVSMNYQGFISLFSNNEPLLDTRIFDFLAYARQKLPRAKHALFTNGTNLTPENYNKLVSTLDYLFIDNYSDDLEVLPHLKWIVTEEPDNGDCLVNFMIRKKTQILGNRGGTAPNKQSKIIFNSSCVLPFAQMIVRPDGKLSMCCQDAYGNETLGDLAVETVAEAWKNKKYLEVRQKLLDNGRSSLQSCVNCDLFGLQNYFPVKLLSIYAQVLVDKIWDELEKGKKIYLYSTGHEADHIEDLLRSHGIWDVKHISDYHDDLMDENVFLILAFYQWELLARIDPNNELLGTKYLVFHNMKNHHIETFQARPSGSLENLRKTIEASQKGNLVMFGAGITAKRIQEKFPLNIKYYIDNDKEKQKSDFMGAQVRPIEGYVDGDLILIATKAEDQIRKQLISFEIPQDCILSGNRILSL